MLSKVLRYSSKRMIAKYSEAYENCNILLDVVKYNSDI